MADTNLDVGAHQRGGLTPGAWQSSARTPEDVITVGQWSAIVNYLQDDTLRIEIDGPAADELKISISMEIE